MYNGIGLQTTRGTGTSGHVQRNLASVRRHTPRNIPPATRRRRNTPSHLSAHEQLRKVEVAVAELVDDLSARGYQSSKIEEMAQRLRQDLMARGEGEKEGERDRDVHQRKMKRIKGERGTPSTGAPRFKNAFAVSDHYKEGDFLQTMRKTQREKHHPDAQGMDIGDTPHSNNSKPPNHPTATPQPEQPNDPAARMSDSSSSLSSSSRSSLPEMQNLSTVDVQPLNPTTKRQRDPDNVSQDAAAAVPPKRHHTLPPSPQSSPPSNSTPIRPSPQPRALPSSTPSPPNSPSPSPRQVPRFQHASATESHSAPPRSALVPSVSSPRHPRIVARYDRARVRHRRGRSPRGGRRSRYRQYSSEESDDYDRRSRRRGSYGRRRRASRGRDGYYSGDEDEYSYDSGSSSYSSVSSRGRRTSRERASARLERRSRYATRKEYSSEEDDRRYCERRDRNGNLGRKVGRSRRDYYERDYRQKGSSRRERRSSRELDTRSSSYSDDDDRGQRKSSRGNRYGRERNYSKRDGYYADDELRERSRSPSQLRRNYWSSHREHYSDRRSWGDEKGRDESWDTRRGASRSQAREGYDRRRRVRRRHEDENESYRADGRRSEDFGDAYERSRRDAYDGDERFQRGAEYVESYLRHARSARPRSDDDSDF